MKIAQKTDTRKINWPSFRYMVFDTPKQPGPLEERLAVLESSIPQDHPYVSVVKREQCKGREHLEKVAMSILEMGGEGVILRKPRSFYKGGRSDTYLKFKVF